MKDQVKPKTLVLGIGNPILSDDGVGLRVAQEIRKKIADAEVRETSNAGLSLLEEISGFDRLILIDSILTGKKAPGDLWKFSLDDLTSSSSSNHGIGIKGAMELGSRLGYALPHEVSVYAVEIEDNTTFCESCTKIVDNAIPHIVDKIIKEENLIKTYSLEVHCSGRACSTP